ncbi:lysophospholipid acyltransferase family protein [Curtobacterium aetherium]|uniref:1-acyl-sn-glycerol-3-phosphate acyltransferase n=1 Tax=Curtobacterium aetherium TaxID=2841594 RepID=A0ACD1E7E9_9MICO|nr:lysophospholipid acyltransferase family protein [Curtobacterium sp. L6-1]QWS34835.1 1-acyl-sn-glycerol-3-phosphate acyltransferase [Curtobacterium sp. L6-1]
MLYWLLKNFVLGPLILTLFRPWVIGREYVPTTGPVIFASNHVSFIDSVILPAVLDRRLSFLAKSDYFTGRGLKGWATKTFFNAIGQLPIDRSGGKASEASLRTGLQVLARGEQLGIYPEGTRSPDGTLYRGRTGIARMVLEGRVLVVPVAMIGTREVQQIGQKFPKFKRVGVVFGKPLDFSRFEGLETDRFILRSVTDEIMHELRGLSRQQYEDVYATSVKERATTARETVMRERRATPGR